MELNSLAEIIMVGGCLGIALILGPLMLSQKTNEASSDYQRRRDLILGNIKPRREASGRAHEDDFKYSTLIDRYKMSFVLSQQRPDQTFQFGPEPAQATKNVIDSSCRARESMEKMCREEFQIDILQLAAGNKEAADLLKTFRKNNLE